MSELIALAINKYGKLKELAATVALKLAPGPNGAAGPLLASEDATLVDIVIKSMKDDPIDEIAKFFNPVLRATMITLDLKVLVFFARNFPPNKLKDLLTGYMNGSSYYYDVECWLDRILYAPKFLRDIFAHELERKLG